MKLNLNLSLNDLEGKEIPGSNIGKFVARTLYYLIGNNSRIEPIKAIEWARKLYNGEEIDVDKQELELLKNFVKSNENFTNVVKAEIEEIIINLINSK